MPAKQSGWITDFAFKVLNLHRLTASCYVANIGSAKAFIKVGWRQEGLRPRHSYCAGEYVDAIMLGIICED